MSVAGAVIAIAVAVMGAIAIWIMRDVTDTARGDRQDEYDWDI